MRLTAKSLFYFITAGVLLVLFATLELPKIQTMNSSLKSELVKNGYTDIYFSSKGQKLTNLKCVDSINSIQVSSLYLTAKKNSESRVILVCYTLAVFKTYDTKEIPSLPFLVDKNLAITAYKDNEAALKIINTVIQ